MEIYTGHCSYCNKLIKHQKNWIRHCKSKKHLKKKQEKEDIVKVSQKVSQKVA